MPLVNRKLTEATHIESLVNNGAVESKFLEFKKGQPIPTDDPKQKLEFQKDVSAFANSEGGTIIYGVAQDRENGGHMCEAFSLQDADKSILRWQSILRDNIRPPIFGMEILPIASGDQFYIVVHVNKSLTAPHMVTGDRSFSYRTSAGSAPMDVEDLRIVFLSSASFFERANNWRHKRVTFIESDRQAEHMVAVHCIPLSFGPEYHVNMQLVGNQYRLLAPLFRSLSGARHRYNIDGFIQYVSNGEGTFYHDSVQFMRNGQIEAISHIEKGADLPGQSVEVEVMRSVMYYLKAQEESGVNPPVLVGVSLLNLQRRKLSSKFLEPFFHQNQRDEAFDRQIIELPFVAINEWPKDEDEFSKTMQPMCDALWNAVGRAVSPSYDENGTFRSKWW